MILHARQHLAEDRSLDRARRVEIGLTFLRPVICGDVHVYIRQETLPRQLQQLQFDIPVPGFGVLIQDFTSHICLVVEDLQSKP